jgi:SAM-dependent methyltransferase
VVRQFERPSGALGRLAGWIMAHRPSNRERNFWTVSLLDIQPTDRVLEIGFGPGLAIERAARLAARGRVVGLDHSEVMWRAASRRNRAAIEEGLVELRRADVAELPTPSLGFDKVFIVNCMMFWPDPVAVLRRLREVMRPGGTLAVTHQPRKAGATEADVERSAREIRALFEQADLEPWRSERLALVPVAALCELARRPSEP